MGPLAKQLTQAWAAATVLGVQDQVKVPLYEGIRKTQTVKTPSDIGEVFVAAGIPAEDYHRAMTSFETRMLTDQQHKTAQDLRVVEDVRELEVPAVFVNGRYRVNNGGLDTSSTEAYRDEFADVVVNFLLTRG
ncbi:MAG: protein disulfide isomerase [Nocardia sp.]|uniref:DsbA family protein n=1 Tax=Nocardia sp. TaxID=1821 RepID=UPI00262F3209|nr:DsbA family protein [Nocardia sp.]MCU1646181.1 protein disulfide isomerase [Nocardia sp.]